MESAKTVLLLVKTNRLIIIKLQQLNKQKKQQQQYKINKLQLQLVHIITTTIIIILTK